MANPIMNIFRVPELRKKVSYTLLALVVYRFGAHLPTPGIIPDQLFEFFSQQSGGLGNLLGIMDLFAGGALLKFTVLGLGIMPYITASIIMQLLQVTIPQLEKLAREGEQGRKKINQYTRYFTLVLCMVQSFGIANGLAMGFGQTAAGETPNFIMPFFAENTFLFTLLVMVTVTTGTMFLVWLGEQISENGIGNGISLIIFAGIISRLPGAVLKTFGKVNTDDTLSPLVVVIVFLILAVVIFFVVYEESGQRRIPVQYAKRVVGRKVYGAQSSHIPFKINPSGVIPIIFASAVVNFPAMLGSVVHGKVEWLSDLLIIFSYGSPAYITLLFFLVIGFAYLYTSVQFNPVDIADNLKRAGGFIPGIRPGTHTAEYLQTVLTRITVAGSIFLAMIAIFPDVLMKIPMFRNVPRELPYLMGGTSLLIMVSVGLDTLKQVESQLQMHNYDGFMDRETKSYRR